MKTYQERTQLLVGNLHEVLNQVDKSLVYIQGKSIEHKEAWPILFIKLQGECEEALAALHKWRDRDD